MQAKVSDDNHAGTLIPLVPESRDSLLDLVVGSVRLAAIPTIRMATSGFFSLFDQAAAWQVIASGHAEGRLSPVAADGQSGLRMDYDFHGGGGFVVIRLVRRITLPQTFAIGFRLRGAGPPNHFEFKVAGPGGANVWRHQRQGYALPADWSEILLTERDLLFAWGPAGGGAPSDVEAIEFVIAAGPGGQGVLELAAPWLEDQTPHQPSEVHASSCQFPGWMADQDPASAWCAAANDPQPWWEADFGRVTRFGGVVIRWPEPLPPRAYQVEMSADHAAWTRIYQASGARGAISHIPAPGAEARFLRITFGDARCAAVLGVALRPDAFARTPNEFIHSVAADFPRGWFPRYWSREQSYWTPVGSPAGKRRALINEEGMVETDEAGFSLEPFVLTENGLLTWAQAATTPELPRGGAPVPSVTWRAPGITLDVLPWVDGREEDLTLHVSYRLRRRKPLAAIRLAVAVRPFQVNPPWQAFRNLGGRSAIHRIRCAAGGMSVGDRVITCVPHPSGMGAAAFEEGGAIAWLAEGGIPPCKRIDDDSGLGSAVMVWDMPPGESVLEVTVYYPYFATLNPPVKNGRSNALARWRNTLGKVVWQVPACAGPAFDCFRTAAGQILINRDGPAIQPGPRRYTRSWVRDCVIMGAALAKAGLPHALREFLTWYAPFQRDDGFIPCVVDRDGVDWLVEHDSHGQFLWGVREVFRAGTDRRFLRKMLGHVRKAANYLLELRAQRQTDAYRSGELAACFGLLPESASHEGYLAHPVHSYWDDFWGVRGLEAAAEIATTLGLSDDATRWQQAAGDFQNDLLRSLERVIAASHLTYIPGSVEWADFDPTATANAIAMLDFAGVLPPGPMHAMLETYLDGFRRKHRGDMPWNNYTAYEIRIIGAFVRLGKRAEANELLEFFLSDRRPCAWNQWPEITWRDPRAPGHLGDVPHTWIAAEYLLALASMVACEREASASLVLASGMPWAWIAGSNGFTVSHLPTRFGPLDFHIAAEDDDHIRVSVGGSIGMPSGGLFIAPPLPPGRRILRSEGSNGNAAAVDPAGESVAVSGLPFEAVLQLGGAL